MKVFEWVQSPEKVFPKGYVQWALSVRRALYLLAAFYAPQIEAWMKANAPWTDRTGNARQSLRAAVLEFSWGVAIEMRYGNPGGEIEYAGALEYANAGRYSIIAPALDHWAPILISATKQTLGFK